MKKKKKLIFILVFVLLLLTSGIIGGLKYKKYLNIKRYEVIKEELTEEATKYLKISNPYCTPGDANYTITEETLLVQWAMDKNKLLDIDKKSYCMARIEVMCVDENKLDTDVYLKCKDYEDENYSNWEERYQFLGTILDIQNDSIIVEPVNGTNERKTSDKIIIKKINDDIYVIGNKVKITYNGNINESYPAQITATEIEIVK